MAMQIHGNYGYPKTQWTEETKEKQAAAAAEKEWEKKDSGRLSDPQDEYIPSEKQQKKPEICVGDTNGVDREIRTLKEKKQQLEQQIQSASGDEKKVRELEKKLAQVEQALSQKDNDAYRRQHTVFSGAK